MNINVFMIGDWVYSSFAKYPCKITHYCIEDEPNHYDWVNNVEVVEYDEIKEGGEE